MEPGEYRYNFQVQLPFGLPTSIEAQIGHIRYGLQVVLDRPRWHDQKFEEIFTVIKPLNLNHDITLRVSALHYENNQQIHLTSMLFQTFFKPVASNR